MKYVNKDGTSFEVNFWGILAILVFMKLLFLNKNEER